MRTGIDRLEPDLAADQLRPRRPTPRWQGLDLGPDRPRGTLTGIGDHGRHAPARVGPTMPRPEAPGNVDRRARIAGRTSPPTLFTDLGLSGGRIYVVVHMIGILSNL